MAHNCLASGEALRTSRQEASAHVEDRFAIPPHLTGQGTAVGTTGLGSGRADQNQRLPSVSLHLRGTLNDEACPPATAPALL